MSDEQKNEIVLTPVRPLVSAEQAAADIQLFEDLKRKILTDDDSVTIAGNQHFKKSAFRRFALVFNLSDRIIEQVRTDREDGSFTWRIVVETIAPNNRTCTGVGVCDSRERKFAHVEHDVYATAHTRSKNRAISDMVAGGIVSFEEMEVSSTEPSTSMDPNSEDLDDLASPIGSSQQPAGEDTSKADAVISYSVQGSDAVFKVPFTAKDRFKQVIHNATGSYPQWDNSTKTWSIDVDLVTHVLLEELEKAGLDVEVV